MKKTKPKLKLDWATHKAAKYACETWHYSKKIPKSKLVKIGVWENEAFIGCVIFSYGATPQIGSPYGLKQNEICELTRIALKRHESPVSRIMAIAIKMFARLCPGTKLIVSYACLDQDHHGGIYQATNWIYVGRTKPDCYIKVKGKVEHRKTVYDRYGCQSLAWIRKHVDANAIRISDSGKHKYLYPIDKDLAKKISLLRKPYPKRATSIDSDATGFQPVEGGATPTVALQHTSGQEAKLIG